MAKVNILIALYSALLLVAFTSATRDWQSEESSSCSRVNLKHCENYIKEQMEDDEDNVLTLKGINYVLQRRYEDDNEKKCCNELNDLDSPECQCRALKKIMENQSEKFQRSSERRDMKKEIMKLPNTCGFGPLFGCHFD